MDPFLAFKWIDYEGDHLEIPVGGVHLWLIEPSAIYERYLDSAELLRYERILNPEVRASYSCAQGGLRRLAGIYMVNQLLHPPHVDHVAAFVTGDRHQTLPVLRLGSDPIQLGVTSLDLGDLLGRHAPSAPSWP